jgi:hypothetical protein
MMTKTIKWTLQLVNEPNLLKESNTGFILISQKFPDYLCKIFVQSATNSSYISDWCNSDSNSQTKINITTLDEDHTLSVIGDINTLTSALKGGGG